MAEVLSVIVSKSASAVNNLFIAVCVFIVIRDYILFITMQSYEERIIEYTAFPYPAREKPYYMDAF